MDAERAPAIAADQTPLDRHIHDRAWIWPSLICDTKLSVVAVAATDPVGLDPSAEAVVAAAATVLLLPVFPVCAGAWIWPSPIWETRGNVLVADADADAVAAAVGETVLSSLALWPDEPASVC